MKVVVVGAGIAGLAAAWELAQARCDVTIVDSERRPGGVMITERRDGFVIEGGPDSWLVAEPEIPRLAEELGVRDRIVRQSAQGSALWNGAELKPLAEGQAAALLGIEVKPGELPPGFVSFAGGMGELVDALVARLGAQLRAPLGISGITPSRSGWRLAVSGGAGLEAEALVLAIPAYAAGRLLEQAGAKGARELGDVVYTPSLTVSLAYRAEQIETRLLGTGFVVSAAGLQVRACTFASQKFPGRAPQGHALLRAFLAPSDDEPAQAAHAELRTILRIRGEPLWSRAFSWPRGLPRYPANHAKHVAAVRAQLDRLPPIAIAGAGYDGAGVSACVRSGREAGRAIAQLLAR